MRAGNKPSAPGKPPRAHVPNGLKEINFSVSGNQAVIGPRKFPNSRFFDRPVPNIHELGGVTVASTFRKRQVKVYPERSFMYSAVKSLQAKNKIAPRFSVTLRSSL